MKRYVMFGHGHLFGDLLEIVHANGGVLTQVVQNIPEVPHPTRPLLRERLERLRDSGWNPSNVNRGVEVRVISLDDFVPEPGEHYLVGFKGIGIEPLADSLRRRFGIRFQPLIHPAALVSPTARTAEGAVIHAGVIIGSGSAIGRHAMINKGAIIGHDVSVDPFAVVQPGARLAGHVRVGRGSLIGIGSTVIEDCTIGEQSVIAAGAVVIKDVGAGTMVAGVPAQIRKRLNEKSE